MTEAFNPVDIKWNTVNIAAICLNGETNAIKRNFDEPDDFIADGIRFSDNYWDLGNKRIVDNGYPRFDFTQIISKPFRVILKLMVIRNRYYVGNSFNQIKEIFYNVVKFVKYLNSEKHIDRVEFITPSSISNFIESYKNHSSKYREGLLSSLEKFIQELELGGYDDDSLIIDLIKEIKKQKKSNPISYNKHQNIPRKFYKAIIDCALEDLRNVHLHIENRIMACLIVILGETGMRKGECRLLEAGKLKDITVFEGKPKAYFLEFWTYKTTVGAGRWTKSKAFSNMIEAYKMLENLTKEKREKFEINYLVTNNKGNVLSKATFYNRFYDFFHRNRNKLNIDSLANYELFQLNLHRFSKWNWLEYREEKSKDWIGTTFYAVTPHQFRVHMANFLRDKGLSLEWIKEHMNHMSEDMTKWYFRDPDEIQKAMINNSSPDGTVLEPNEYTVVEMTEEDLKQAYETINKFLKKNKLNIFRDFDEILTIWQYNPLNESLVGLCRKAIGAICERQEKLSTLEKWYYISPQFPDISSFDFTYERFKEKVKIVEHNKALFENEEIYKRSYEVEYGSLKKYYKNRLKPEYDLVLSTLGEKGLDYITTALPNLKKVVNQLDLIDKEIQKWVTNLKLESPLKNEQKNMELVN
ncbi:site-specific integrase [Oceanobacillus damuensis]|uniref:site-specific integrase n=1 Tax=Oceanobacillus damuensis TaxID=937928 RepID=UPI0008368806|nr:site-specific integrase [Oceanobacillus damuensis]